MARGAKVRVVDDLTSGHLDNLNEPRPKGLVEFVKADLRGPGNGQLTGISRRKTKKR